MELVKKKLARSTKRMPPCWLSQGNLVKPLRQGEKALCSLLLSLSHR